MLLMSLFCSNVQAGVGTNLIRDTAEIIVNKFGLGVTGNSLEQVINKTAVAVGKHGEESLPFLRQSGHIGFSVLESAGKQSQMIIRLFDSKGNDAIWLVRQDLKLELFLRYGDSAAEVMIKHPGLADDLIRLYGNDAIGALASLSRKNAQRLSMIVADGHLDKLQKNKEILQVIRRYGDEAMDFIWKNKGALTISALLSQFLVNPEVYIQGAKELIVEPIIEPVVTSFNWMVIMFVVLFFITLKYGWRKKLSFFRKVLS